MDTQLPDGLTFDPEIRGWENICAWYHGKLAGEIHHRRAPHDGWWADACNVCLGAFDTRDEGKQAIIDWFRGLEIEEWPAASEVVNRCSIRLCRQ